MNYALDTQLKSHIAHNLSRLERVQSADPSLRRAAVAVLVSGEEPGAMADVVVTLRAARLNRHSGQFALPGGRLDEGESAVEAALRETHEEIGLSLGEEAVLGLLDDMVTRSGFVITPVDTPSKSYEQTATTKEEGVATLASGDRTTRLPLGRYVIQETTPTEPAGGVWSLDSLICDGEPVPTAQGAAGIQLTADAPAVDCTF